VAFIGVVSLVGLYRMDAFKTIENNTPEFCETFNMDGSAEDIEIDYERGYAYLSFQDRAALTSKTTLLNSVKRSIWMVALKISK